MLLARLCPSRPASPRLRLLMNVPFVYPCAAESAGCDPRAPNMASNSGSATWPGRPALAKLLTPLAWLIARFLCAFLNSYTKPFSMMLTSFTLYVRQTLVLRLPRYRASMTVFFESARCTPMFHDCTYGIFRSFFIVWKPVVPNAKSDCGQTS